MPKAPVKTSNSLEALAGEECTIQRKKGRKPPLCTAPKGASGTIGDRAPTVRRPKHLTIGQIRAGMGELEEVCISDGLCVVAGGAHRLQVVATRGSCLGERLRRALGANKGVGVVDTQGWIRSTEARQCARHLG